MRALCFTDARRDLTAVMDRVLTDREPVVITRRTAEAVVFVAQDDWVAMEVAVASASPPSRG